MDALKPALARLATGDPLSQTEARDAFTVIMSGEASPAQIGAFLMGLKMRGEAVSEIAGAVSVMREKMLPVDAPDNAIDIVGTGGDGKGSYNVSTAAAFVVAGAGVPVAKHGNRAISSKSGAADVLKALGIDIELGPEQISACIHEAGVGFMFAPMHHAAMKHVGPARAEMGLRTIFNLLGPLSNPASVKRQLVGVYDRAWVVPIAEALRQLGCEAAMVVHGSDGLDEITTTGPTHAARLDDGTIREIEINPQETGLANVDPDALVGGDPEHNASALRDVLGGAKGAYTDIVLINAGAALMVAGKAETIAEGMALARAAISEGKASAVLEKLVAVSNR